MSAANLDWQSSADQAGAALRPGPDDEGPGRGGPGQDRPLQRPGTNRTDAAVFAELAARRISARAFLPEPLPRADIERALALACRAPSNCNTQPWLIAVACGAARNRLAAAIGAEMRAGRMKPDLPYDARYEGIHRERQFAAAAALYAAAGIARKDKAAREAQFMRNYDFFGAPHVAFFFLPPGFGTREAADLGMCAQTFMLALTAMGHASCPQTALSFHPELVRAEFGLPADCRLLFGISFGRADPSAAVNALQLPRDVAACTLIRED
ncbi:nitroreductase [Thauera sinica]|uniref:Nitroreductase n=1 Tax=Thauera sinica TaxID=2665146 RepID=A0ABW1ANR6_9RHOO|nr:nitroreductase [Thauera sp. K11]ATE62030.1 nitroreductase [Thauera sp. K11]